MGKKLIEWKKGQKEISLLNCFKPKQKEPLSVPSILPGNTLYVPIQSSGRNVMRQLRNAFCHGSLEYDNQTGQYVIKFSDKKNIAGKFSIEAIREFVEVYLQPKEPKKTKKK